MHTLRRNKLLSETLTNGFYNANDRTSAFDYQEKIIAGYTSIGYQFDEKNYFKVGLRFENTYFIGEDIFTKNQNTQIYTNWFPSIYYSRNLLDKNTLSLSYSKRLRRPSFNSLNNRVYKINDFRYDVGNPKLFPEFFDRYEISFLTKKSSSSLYLSKTIDAINGIWSIENNIAIHQNVNFGTNKQYGFEYSFLDNITKWWRVKVVGEVFHKTFKNSNFDISKSTAFFNIRNTYRINESTSVVCSGNYMSPFISANYINAANYSVNMMVTSSLFNNKLQARLYLDDIFNTVRIKNKAAFIDSDFKFYQKRNTRSITLRMLYQFEAKNKIRNDRNNSQNNIKGRL